MDHHEVNSNAFTGATLASARPCRLALLTDFGAGPYVGQMQLLLSALAPGVPAVSLISNLPAFRPELAAYLLPWLRRGMPSGTQCLSGHFLQVDIGMGERILAISLSFPESLAWEVAVVSRRIKANNKQK